jgi:hypothetical protein
MPIVRGYMVLIKNKKIHNKLKFIFFPSNFIYNKEKQY